ncbi:hypothetical protein JCM10450v2_002279 [Rhodotorula kratochvilovae]
MPVLQTCVTLQAASNVQPRYFWSPPPPRIEMVAAAPPKEDVKRLEATNKLEPEDIWRLWGLRTQDGWQRTLSEPVDALSTARKLSAAIALVSSWVDQLPGQGRQHARVLELLGSAMLDVAATQPYLSSASRVAFDPSPTIAEMREELGLSPPAPAPVATPQAAFADDHADDDGESAIARQLSAIIADNCRLACALTCSPDLLAPTEHQTSGPAAPSEPEPVEPCYIDKLPPELLRIIIACAYDEILALDPSGEEPQQPLGGVEVSADDARKMAATAFVMSCAEVSKAWVEPATSVRRASATATSLSASDTRFGYPLVALNKHLSERGGAAHALQISSIDILVPSPPHASGRSPQLNRAYARRNAAPSALGSSVVAEPKPPVIDGKELNAGDEVAKLVGHAASLRSLTLTVQRDPEDYSRSSVSLDPPLLDALSSIPQLTSLTLVSAIDFDELEHIMSNLPALETLVLGAVYDISGVTVAPAPHSASRIRVFHIKQDVYEQLYFCPLSADELCWLIEPAATSGALRDVQITVRNRSRHGGGGVGTAAFATKDFADLILLCAPHLERLVLHDLDRSSGLDPSLNNPPHDGSFDHLVSHLTLIQELTLPWFLISDAFLAAVATLPSLASLTLHGTPTTTSSSAFLTALETRFPALETLALIGDTVGGTDPVTGLPIQNDWSSRAMRKIKQAARGREIEVTVGQDA